MKPVFLALTALAALLAAAPSRAEVPASFDTALSAYHADRHEAAREAFLRMARDGRADAQFNAAVMLARGQGGIPDPIEAALWMTLSAEAGQENAKEALEALNGLLESEQREEVEELLPRWRDDHFRDALFARHAPEFCADCEYPDIDRSDRRNLELLLKEGKLRIERVAPRYPREAASDRIVGEVEMGAWLSEDGRLEQPHVLFSDPPGTFDNSALRALKRWEFEWRVPAQERSEIYIVQTIQFTLDELAANYEFERSLRQDLARALESVEENAFPAYAAAATLQFIGLEVDPDRPSRLIEILELAARQGVVRAQLDLAERLAAGNRVRVDREAGLFWLKQAAYHGEARAQFRLSTLESQIGGDLARHFGAAAESRGYAPAILTAVRREMHGDEPPDLARLAALMDTLPESWRRANRGDELIGRVEALLESNGSS